MNARSTVTLAVAETDVRARMFEAALFPVQPPTTPAQWGTMLRQDIQAWAELVRSSGATIN